MNSKRLGNTVLYTDVSGKGDKHPLLIKLTATKIESKTRAKIFSDIPQRRLSLMNVINLVWEGVL